VIKEKTTIRSQNAVALIQKLDHPLLIVFLPHVVTVGVIVDVKLAPDLITFLRALK
jgi:hypothetical protein